MHFALSRRQFLQSTASTAVGVALAGRLQSSCAGDDSRPLFRISLAEWSLHKTLFDDKLDHLDFAKYTKDEFDIHAVEYVNQFFADKAEDAKYLAEMKKRATDNGVQSLLIMIDREGDLGDPDKKKRTEAVENHHKWVEAAKFLGCHSIRVNAKSGGSYKEQVERAADGLRRLSKYAAGYDMNVIVENHGGLSSNGKWLSTVIEKVNLPNCGTLPDFGNFELGEGQWYDRYQGVRELMPFAKAVSAKSYQFDPHGNDVRTDFFKIMKIVLDAGYHGYVGIEYEGSELSEPDGIRATKRLLERVREKLTTG